MNVKWLKWFDLRKIKEIKLNKELILFLEFLLVILQFFQQLKG